MAESTDNLAEEKKIVNGDEVKNESAEITESKETTEKVTEATEKPTEASAEEQANEEEPSAKLLAKIRKQVEFYFGDVNMQRDKFLIEQSKLDDGWVPMSVMLNFKMLAALSKNVNVISKALEDSELMEISSDRKKIRRSTEKPLPVYDESYRKGQEERTIYLKGFPTDTTIAMLKKYFETNDAVENIIMRRYKKGTEQCFKGSILVLFKTLEDAKTFISQESIKYKDTELIKMWLKDYAASKEKEKEERRQKKNDNSKGQKNQKNKPNNKFPKGCILHMANIDKELKIDTIKEKFAELECKVAFVDYNSSNTEGYVRLHGENAAADLLKKLESNVVNISECDITCSLVEGEKEDEYLNKIQENANTRYNRRDKGRHGRKGFKRRNSPSRNENGKKAKLGD